MAIDSIGKVIKSKRKQMGLHQSDLSTQSGIKTFRIGRIERGEVQPRWSEVMSLTKVLGIEIWIIKDYDKIIE